MFKKYCIFCFVMLCSLYTLNLFADKRETLLDRKISLHKNIIWKLPKYPKICESLNTEKKQIDIGDGCSLYVETEGKGIPVVLLNGGPGNDHYIFHPSFENAASFAEVIYYDQRGCGQSSYCKGKDGKYSLGQSVEDLDKLRKALGFEKWVLIGHSFGGFLAQAYTLKYPEHVEGLILVCASTGMKRLNLKPDRESEYISREELNKFVEIEFEIYKKVKCGELSREKGKEIQIYNKMLNGEWKQQNYYKPSERKIAEFAEYCWKPDKDFREEMFYSMNLYDLTDAFIKCPIPTMIIEGKYDMTWDTDKPEKFEKQHPGSDLIIFNESGHEPFNDEPEKFFALLKNFILNLPKVTHMQIENWKKNIPEYIKSTENKTVQTGNKKIPANIVCDAQYDVGFYVASYLNLPGVAICLYDKRVIKEMNEAKKKMNIDSELLDKEAPLLSKELTTHWKVHRLVRVPIYFNSFNDTETAYKILLGEVKINIDNAGIYKNLIDNILELYPFLDDFKGEDRKIAERLINLIEYEYYHFYKRYYDLNKEKFRKESENFKDAWLKEYEPALNILNSKSNAIKKVEIILSPALQKHGKSFRVINGVGRVASLLPENSEELQRGLINAYHEMCHGITDQIVYSEMNLEKADMSFKSDEKGSEIHSLIENAADEAMYIGLKAANPKMLDYFFSSTGYGDLSWMIKQDAFENSINITDRKLSKTELDKLKSEMKVDPVKTSKYIYEEGLLLNPKVFAKIKQCVENK